MTIAEALLPKLSEWEPAGPGRLSQVHPVAETGWAMNALVDRTDSLGSLLWEITLTRPLEAAIANADLKQRALIVADRVTGLMEPLHFVELDELRGEALLRSESPTKRSASLAYYEVIMTGGRRIAIRRYQRSNEKNRREQVAFALTHEAIAKLIDDLVRE
jgi:hypothetical protein